MPDEVSSVDSDIGLQFEIDLVPAEIPSDCQLIQLLFGIK
jgi:hypothetical protein